MELDKLLKFRSDKKFLAELQNVKEAKKKQFANYLEDRFHIELNPSWLLSVQVKRIHEYKRQLMNVLNVILLFIKANRGEKVFPRAYIIGNIYF